MEQACSAEKRLLENKEKIGNFKCRQDTQEKIIHQNYILNAKLLKIQQGDQVESENKWKSK